MSLWRSFCLFASLSSLSAGTILADEPSLASRQSETEAWSKIVACRGALDQALAFDTRLVSPEDLATRKKHATDKASQLQKMATDFSTKFVLSTNLLRSFEHGAFALGVDGLLNHQISLSGAIYGVTGVEWASQFIKYAPTLNGQEEVIRGVIETNLVSGAIAALQFKPTNSIVFSTLLELAQKATSSAGKTLARELISNQSLPSDWVNSARSILNREYSIGHPFDMEFRALDGRTVDLKNLRGKVVLVNFWGTACAPCIVELPEFKIMYERNRDRGFEIVGIILDDQVSPVKKVLKEHGIPWPNTMDDHASTNGLAARCGIFGIPNNWLVDRKGNLREIAARQNLEQKIEVLLGEPR